jgi:hypothetical protein
MPRRSRGSYRSSIVTVILRKVADGVYWIEDADGMPLALVTTLEDGTPLKAAEPWWAASSRMLELDWGQSRGRPLPAG